MSNELDLVRTNRRRLVGAAAFAGSAVTLSAPFIRPALAQDEDDPPPTEQPEDETEPIGQATPPAWIFTVVNVFDPFEGQVEQAEEIPGGSRVVTALVQVDNDSEQALEVSPYYVRFRDADGADYQGGYVTGGGTIPQLNQRTLNPGERARGWIWAAVPENAALLEIVFGAPSPQLRVPLPTSEA
jgi:hypothetical protein